MIQRLRLRLPTSKSLRLYYGRMVLFGVHNHHCRHYQPRRNHLTHATPSINTSSSISGPRAPVSIGLDATKHSSNILRLLESSHGPHAVSYNDTVSTAYHPRASIWQWSSRDRGGDWKMTLVSSSDNASHTTTVDTSHSHDHDHNRGRSGTNVSAKDQEPTERLEEVISRKRRRPLVQPFLVSLSLSDDRTALVKMRGADGRFRFLSLLRLDSEYAPSAAQMTHVGAGIIANDGWFIIREVIAGNDDDNGSTKIASAAAGAEVGTLSSLQQAIATYYLIEHGGGSSHQSRAEILFAPGASLATIGSESATDTAETPENDEWSAPVGSFLEISRDTYMAGVGSQTPHGAKSSSFDHIHTLDMCGNVAAVTLQVGNGAQTRIFVDHLLLGLSLGDDHLSKDSSGREEWRILSKTFSPQAWPE